MSRIVGIIAPIIQVLNLGAVFIGGWKPQYALIVAAVAHGLSAFTERIQGGLSKVQ